MTVIKFPELRDLLHQDTRKTILDSVVEDTKFAVSTFKDFRPAVDIAESETKYIILVSLPGLNKDDFKVELTGTRLVVRGEYKLAPGLQGLQFHKREIKQGSFARSFLLPDNVDTSAIDAAYNNGILTLSLQKLANVETPATKQVNVK